MNTILTAGDRAERPHHVSLRVLYVEDDRLVSSTTEQALELLGCRVTIEPDAEAALARLERAVDFDVVVSDYRLPGRDGCEFLREVRARWQLPGVLASGDAIERELIPSETWVLPKPFSTRDLLDLLYKTQRSKTH